MEMCRACLTTGSNMAQLNEPFINGYNLLTNLNISLFDNMPQYSCESCTQTVKFFLDFREKCVTSESTLHQILLEKIKPENADIELNGNRNNDIFNIKQEVKVEKIDDSESDIYFDDVLYIANNGDDINMMINEEGSEDVKPKRSKRIKSEKNKKAKQKTKLVKKLEELLEMPCGLCKKKFKDKDVLNKHIESHKGENRCDICSEMYRSWPALFGHRFTHLAKKEWRRCHICNKALFSDAHSEYHYLKLHYDGENKSLLCKHCLKPYETPRKLKKHIHSAHSLLRVVCDICNRNFNNKQKLKSHIKTHSENKSYICDLCGFSCKQSTGLKSHKIRKHAPKKATCKNCQNVFATGEDLEKHICKEATFKVCPFCGKKVIGSKRLSRHLESHREVGRHRCDRCPAVYKTRGALRVHINRHDGVRSQQCEFCPLKFYSLSVLIKHRRVHTGEKPYVCKICDKGFTGNHNLKVHMKVHGEHLVVKRNKDTEEVTSAVFK